MMDSILIAIIVAAVTAFWIGFSQIDHMFWALMRFYGAELGVHGFAWACETDWIPEFHISWKNAFILFCCLVIGSFYTLIVVLLLII